MKTVLSISNLEVAYGHVLAVRGVDLELLEGEIRVILGANGAGKTTILKAIFGLQKPRAGRISLFGREIQGLEPHEISRMGISWVPEGRQIWATLSVQENLVMGAFAHPNRQRTRQLMDIMYQRFPILAERRGQAAGSLSGGEQQMLAVARALMTEPKVLLMDEPSLGLAPLITQRVFQLVREINASGVSILMVEQNARQALEVAHWAYLLEVGNLVKSGTATEIEASADVRRVYLGG